MNADARGWRMALVPDALVNTDNAAGAAQTGAARTDVLGLIEAHGYGLLQLPPPGEHGMLIAVIADQIAEYAHHGYAVLAIGMRGVGGVRAKPGDGLHWRRLAPLLRHRGVSLPPRHLIRLDANAAAEAERLADFLSGYDLPAEEQRRWRV